LLYPLDVPWALPVAAFNKNGALMTGDLPEGYNVDLAALLRGNLHHFD
jgi:hypothetical protein